ncbi:hypothetical protein IWW51_006684, partial [Coemansia sp. RSA 2702]
MAAAAAGYAAALGAPLVPEPLDSESLLPLLPDSESVSVPLNSVLVWLPDCSSPAADPADSAPLPAESLAAASDDAAGDSDAPAPAAAESDGLAALAAGLSAGLAPAAADPA